MSSNTQKLRFLRARTDMDLTVLVQRELDRGLALVEVAATRNSPVFARRLERMTRRQRCFPGSPD